MTVARSANDSVERELRADLAAGRYQAVLDRLPHLATADAAERPSIALGVAAAATRLGRLAEGSRLATAALAPFRKRADDDGRMRCLNLLGAIAYERGRLDLAAAHFAAALELGRTLPDLQGWARAANNLAPIAFFRGRVEEARTRFVEAQAVYQRLGDRRGLAETYHNLGIVARQVGQLREAARVAEAAVRHAQVTGDPSLIALTFTGSAEVALAFDDIAVAGERLAYAERLAREAGDELGVADAGRVEAERRLRLGEPDRALAAVEPARATAKRLGSVQLQGECAALAADALDAMGKTTAAGVRRREARRLFTKLGATLLLNRLPVA